MDQSVLVTSGHVLVKALDAAGLPPRVAMWVHSAETDTWKLWILPPETMKDKHEFYRTIAELIAKHRSELGDLAASDVEMVSDTHPAIRGLGMFIHAPGLGSVRFSGNTFNGFYLPDGIVLRAAIERRAAPRAS
jgi:hypothetical protein